ncbi:MAG: OmpA family protein [Pseudomonadota bacterium]
MQKYQEEIQPEEPNPFFIPFFDLMAACILIFILTTLYFMMTQGKIQGVVEKNEKGPLEAKVDYVERQFQDISELDPEMVGAQGAAEDILTKLLNREVYGLREKREQSGRVIDRLKDVLLKKGVRVEVSDDLSVLQIPVDEVFFSKGGHQIPTLSQNKIAKIADALAQTLIKDKNFLLFESIAIEGHTDTDPAPGLFMDNWGLSAHRAISFLNALYADNTYGSVFSGMKNASGDGLFYVSGYSASRPIYEYDRTPKQKNENRRITIRFRLHDRNDLARMVSVFEEINQKKKEIKTWSN